MSFKLLMLSDPAIPESVTAATEWPERLKAELPDLDLHLATSAEAALGVWSEELMVHILLPTGRMRYGTGTSRQRHADVWNQTRRPPACRCSPARECRRKSELDLAERIDTGINDHRHRHQTRRFRRFRSLVCRVHRHPGRHLALAAQHRFQRSTTLSAHAPCHRHAVKWLRPQPAG